MLLTKAYYLCAITTKSCTLLINNIFKWFRTLNLHKQAFMSPWIPYYCNPYYVYLSPCEILSLHII